MEKIRLGAGMSGGSRPTGFFMKGVECFPTGDEGGIVFHRPTEWLKRLFGDSLLEEAIAPFLKGPGVIRFEMDQFVEGLESTGKVLPVPLADGKEIKGLEPGRRGGAGSKKLVDFRLGLRESSGLHQAF